MPERSLGELRNILSATYSRLYSPFTLFILCSSCLVAVLAGPFGTYEHLTIQGRALYWGGIALSGTVIGFGVRAVLLWWTGRESSYGFCLLAAFVLTIIFAPMVIGWRMVMMRYSPGLSVSPSLIIFNTFVISAAIFTMRMLLMPPDAAADELEGEMRGDNIAARLVRRLPEDMQCEILSLTARNHHVEVTTTEGRTILRMRLTDAIIEMEGVEGFCIHRSHWVARHAILRVERLNAQKVVVVLRNGDELPVSRKYRDNLEQAGLIENNTTA